MSEPIEMFDRDGNPVTRYSPNVAQMEVAAGLLFAVQPVLDVDADMPALDGMPDVEPVTVRKAGRPRKGKGAL